MEAVSGRALAKKCYGFPSVLPVAARGMHNIKSLFSRKSLDLH